jgi:hypothetical protein
MTLLLTESFDWFETADIDGKANVYGWLQTYDGRGHTGEADAIEAGRTGNCWKFISGYSGSAAESAYGMIGRALPLPGGSEYVVGFAFKYVSTMRTQGIPFFGTQNDAGHGELTLAITETGAVLLGRTVGYTLWVLAISPANSLPQDDWNYVEIKFKIANAPDGYAIVRINGVEVINVSGVDTLNSSDNLTAVILGSQGYSGGPRTVYFDDVYICDLNGSQNNDFLGDVKVQLLSPNGNGHYSDFTGSDADSADNYLHVDDAGAPDDDSSYVESATPEDQDTYACTNTAGCDTVHGVGVKVIGRKVQAGAVDLKALVRSGTTDSASSALGLGTDYRAKQVIYEQDPDTAAAWTTGGVDAAEFGIEAA